MSYLVMTKAQLLQANEVAKKNNWPRHLETIDDEKEIKKLQDKIDRLQKTVDELSEKLYKHIEFIDKTYDGLKNPIDAARKWLRR